MTQIKDLGSKWPFNKRTLGANLLLKPIIIIVLKKKKVSSCNTQYGRLLHILEFFFIERYQFI